MTRPVKGITPRVAEAVSVVRRRRQRGEAVHLRDIAQALGVSVGAAGQFMRRAEINGRIISPGAGSYRGYTVPEYPYPQDDRADVLRKAAALQAERGLFNHHELAARCDCPVHRVKGWLREFRRDGLIQSPRSGAKKRRPDKPAPPAQATPAKPNPAPAPPPRAFDPMDGVNLRLGQETREYRGGKATSKPKADHVATVRKCLRCRTEFKSAWAGHRVCTECKQSDDYACGEPIPLGGLL